MTKAGTPPKLKGEDLTTLHGIIQTASAAVNKSDEKVPSPTINKRSPALSGRCKNIRRDKFIKDPKLKALLSAFAAFTASYVTYNDIEDDNENTIQDGNNANTKNKDDDDDDVNAFLGMFVSLKE